MPFGAVNGTGASVYAGPASVTTPPKPPLAPSNLQVSVLSQTGLQLTWTDNSNNEDGFEIQRAVGNGAFQPLITLGSNTTSYADSGLVAATTYRYQVRATNAGGDSAFAGPTSATTLPNAPSAPSGLAVTVELAAIPLSADYLAFAGGDIAARLAAATAGDDYELLFALPGGDEPPIGAVSVGRFDAGSGIALTWHGASVPLPASLGFQH